MENLIQKPIISIPSGGTFGVKENLRFNYATAVALLGTMLWDSKEFRELKQKVIEADGSSRIEFDDFELDRDKLQQLVVFDGQVHRGYLTLHVEPMEDESKLSTLITIASTEIAALVNSYVQMRMHQNTPDAPPIEMLGTLTDKPVQEEHKGNERGAYTPLMIEGTWYPQIRSGALFFITLDNTDEPPSPEKAMATQLTYQAVTEWVRSRTAPAVQET